MGAFTTEPAGRLTLADAVSNVHAVKGHREYPALPPPDIYRMNADGNTPTDVASSPQACDVSPDWQTLEED